MGYFHSELTKIPELEMVPQLLNVVAFYLPDDLSLSVRDRIAGFIDEFKLMWFLFSTNPESPDTVPRRLVRCCITRDVQRVWINDFITKLKSALVPE